MPHFNCLYLNNSGHRWVYRDENNNSDRLNVFEPATGKTKSYAVNHWKALGNFAIPYVKIKGKLENLMEYHDNMWMVASDENHKFKYGENVI